MVSPSYEAKSLIDFSSKFWDIKCKTGIDILNYDSFNEFLIECFSLFDLGELRQFSITENNKHICKAIENALKRKQEKLETNIYQENTLLWGCFSLKGVIAMWCIKCKEIVVVIFTLCIVCFIKMHIRRITKWKALF